MEMILEVKNLTKKYGQQTALDHVNMSLQKGDIYGLIGRNGAGKTTLIKSITTLIQTSGGTMSLFGSQNQTEYMAALRRTASIIEMPAAFDSLSAADNLEYYRIQRGIPDKLAGKKALETVGLSDTGKKKFKQFSLGMKQKLGIAIAILNNPDFIILDEPINGLDPIAIIEFRELLLTLNQKYDMTVLLSSHILSEMIQVVNRFGIIHDGNLIRERSKKDFIEDCKASVLIKVVDVKTAAMILDGRNDLSYKVVSEDEIRIFGSEIDIPSLNRFFIEKNIDILSIHQQGSDIEQYFTQAIQEYTTEK